jgi:hypothetical protein
MSQVFIVEHVPPRRERLVGGEDHRALLPVAVVDHVEEHVRRIRSVREIADLVDLCGAPHKSINATPAVMWSQVPVTGHEQAAS